MLNEAQKQLLNFLKAEIGRSSRAPTLAEMARGVSRPPTSTRQTLLALEKRGFIRRIPGLHRALEILHQPGKAANAG